VKRQSKKEQVMTIRDLLVQIDQTQAARHRLEAGLKLAERFGAHLTALCLAAEPFMRSAPGYHLPADVVREHLRHTEAEAESVFAAARQTAQQRGVELETRLETGPLDRLPAILARIARNTDLIVVGEPNPAESGTDETTLVEAAFMDTGRRWSCPIWVPKPCPRPASWSPGTARARRRGRCMTLCRCSVWLKRWRS
jgi:nucleotide-binding universal stress UspA family protein